MNERIKELWTQGTQTVVPREGDYSSVSAKNIEKFAELIVQEHVDLLRKEWYILNNQKKSEEETPRELGIRLGKKAEIISLIHKIKQHFGVEE